MIDIHIYYIFCQRTHEICTRTREIWDRILGSYFKLAFQSFMQNRVMKINQSVCENSTLASARSYRDFQVFTVICCFSFTRIASFLI